MELEELRLGNWISGKYRCQSKDDYIQVESLHNYCINADIDGDGCWDYDSGVIDYEPIPLTPEILEACGFKYHSDNCAMPIWRMLATINALYAADGIFGFVFGANDLKGEYVNQCPVVYVHQLQNLYFALTGKELAVSLTANQSA